MPYNASEIGEYASSRCKLNIRKVYLQFAKLLYPCIIPDAFFSAAASGSSFLAHILAPWDHGAARECWYGDCRRRI